MKEYIVKADHLIDGYGMQAVGELIRCKDCKHFLKARNEDEYDSCAILFEMQDIPLETGEDKYCAWAERKTDHD